MQPKNRVTAAILAFFLGFAGVHKLYLGKIGGFIGFMVMMIVSINISIPLTMIFGVMEGIKLFNMSDQDFDRKYNRGIIQTRSGPLEARRNEQMRRYEQVPESAPKSGMTRKPSPLTTNRANPFKNSGIKKYKDFDLDDAITDFKKGLEIVPNDVALHFNIACAYSLTEKKGLAYDHLSKSVSLGLKDVERILSHDDLAFVRIQPEFEAFRASGFRVNPFVKENAAAPVTTKDIPVEPKIKENDDILDDTLLAQLNKLAELRSKGILSDAEFNFERKKVLRQ